MEKFLEDRNKQYLYGGCILLQALIYGFGNAMTKIAFESITPFWCLTIRFGMASLVFFVFFGKGIIAQLKESSIKEWGPAACCMAAAYIFCNVALSLTTATNVGFLMALSVVFTPFLERLILKKPYGLKNVPIQVLAAFGLYLLCSNGGTLSFGWGEVFGLLTAAANAGAFVFSERSLKNLGAVTISFVQTGLTFLLSLPGVLLLEGNFSLADVTPQAWGVVLYLAIFCTCVAFALQNLALTKLSSATVSVLHCSDPIFTAAVSTVLLGELLSGKGIVGALLIILCIVLGARKNTEEN